MNGSTKLNLYQFPGSGSADLSEVGGKGWSLLKGSECGLPVPPGFILPVQFFLPWFESLKKTKEWTDFLGANKDKLPAVCNALKESAARLSFTKTQHDAVIDALKAWKSNALFAVRSSSPEEDLEGSSFAGGYETILGATQATMEDAIKKAFASCLDLRIVTYKREHGFDVTDPKIAVVVQEQITSEISGVGFSLNPVNNSYDEAVFNANWGLGETVVAGLVTPDTFIIDKTSLKIKSKDIGSKETSIWTLPTGGTTKKTGYRADEQTLSEGELIALTKLLNKVESFYGKPIDIEWAFAEGNLYLLQARPITTYVPLPPEMVTAAGEKKRLYFDATIGLQGIYKPISKMGTSIFKILIKHVNNLLLSEDITSDINKSLPWVSDGRIYVNLSNALQIVGKDNVVEAIFNADPLAAKAIQQAREEEYKSDNGHLKRVLFQSFITHLSLPFSVLEARLFPQATLKRSQKELKHLEEQFDQLDKEDIPLYLLMEKLIHLLLTYVLKYCIPLVIASRIALQKMKSMVDKSLYARELSKLEFALPHNITTEMGLELYEVACSLPDNIDATGLKKGLEAKSLPQEFLQAWDKFMEKYGHRGPGEIDIASPRYREEPSFLLDLLLKLRNTNEGETPPQNFARNTHERYKAYDTLLQHVYSSKGWLESKHFQTLYEVVETLAGYRETHKYYLVLAVDLLRQRVLKEAQKLHASGRLQSTNQVFDLTLQELDNGLVDPSLNLIALAKSNRIFLDRLARVPQLPTIIDSRGLIIRPPVPKASDGEVIGTPISAGTVRGRIKVLRTPDEKPLEKGEILVARATDPGWTPLFINAGGVILEVGGVLQHGALVAREYGLPCVAGIANATNLWADGTEVEVDGSAGSVKILQLPTKNGNPREI